MPYPEMMVAPMRHELIREGFQELRDSEQVEQAMDAMDGTVLMAVNSVCGCAAGIFRPAVSLALEGAKQPDHKVTVFAGQDVRGHGRSAQAPGGLPPLVAFDRAPEGRRYRLHARATPDRRTLGPRDRHRPPGGLRGALLSGDATLPRPPASCTPATRRASTSRHRSRIGRARGSSTGPPARRHSRAARSPWVRGP